MLIDQVINDEISALLCFYQDCQTRLVNMMKLQNILDKCWRLWLAATMMIVFTEQSILYAWNVVFSLGDVTHHEVTPKHYTS